MSKANNPQTTSLLSTRLSIQDVKALAKQVPTPQLIALTKEGTATESRNAAWALTHKTDKEVQQMPQQELVDIILSTPYEWVQRMILSLVERQEIGPEFSTSLLNFCLFRMVNPQFPTGIQALCLKLAYRMSLHYPELAHEFRQTVLLAQDQDFTPGMAHLLRKLRSGKPL